MCKNMNTQIWSNSPKIYPWEVKSCTIQPYSMLFCSCSLIQSSSVWVLRSKYLCCCPFTYRNPHTLCEGRGQARPPRPNWFMKGEPLWWGQCAGRSAGELALSERRRVRTRQEENHLRGKRASASPSLPCTLILDCPASATIEVHFCRLSHPLCGILLQQHWPTIMMR